MKKSTRYAALLLGLTMTFSAVSVAVQPDDHDSAFHDTGNDCCGGGTHNAHGGKTEATVDQHPVEEQVDKYGGDTGLIVTFVWPISRRVLVYTWLIAKGIRPMSMIRRYC